jgi:hypothetical protein
MVVALITGAPRGQGAAARPRTRRTGPRPSTTVAFLLNGQEVVFRTQNGSKLAAASRHAVVGFEVDEIDTATRTGWSVLGIGEAYEILDPSRLDDLALRAPDPWAPGHDARTISIPLQRLTGRRLILR